MRTCNIQLRPTERGFAEMYEDGKCVAHCTLESCFEIIRLAMESDRRCASVLDDLVHETGWDEERRAFIQRYVNKGFTLMDAAIEWRSWLRSKV